jgi:hypothetical protein
LAISDGCIAEARNPDPLPRAVDLGDAGRRISTSSSSSSVAPIILHRVGPPDPIVDPLSNQQPDRADRRAAQLAQQVVQLVVVVGEGVYERGAVDHHQPERHQDANHRQQRVIRFALGRVEHNNL